MRHCTVALSASLVLTLSSAAFADGLAADDWPMFNHDVIGTRFNAGEHRLSQRNANRLHVVWSLATPAPVTGTPAVVGDDLYVGDWNGNFYALDTHDGATDWQIAVAAPISASALVQGDSLYFGDQAGIIYGVDRRTGAMRWQVQPNPHPLAAIFSSPTPILGNIVVGIASNEEEAAGDPTYPCCSFRGSVVMLNPRDGSVVWQTYFVSPAENARGTAGAGVWTSPTYDAELGLIYVGTGNNYSAPSNGMEDSVIALDARTGAIVWVEQAVSNDVHNFGIPILPNTDSDFGDSPQIYRLTNGRKVVSAGNKNGIFYVMDAATGALAGAKILQVGGSLGGLFADSAMADGLVFTNGADWPDPFDFTVLPNFGIVTAVTPDGTDVRWQLKIPQQVALSGVAVANDVVYFATCNPGTGTRLTNSSGTLYAVGAQTGRTLAALPVSSCANGGPAVAHGRVFMGTGDEYLFAGTPTGSIIAYGL
jgi:polyvinyl alcohol dehydrogenase (cytochrome)